MKFIFASLFFCIMAFNGRATADEKDQKPVIGSLEIFGHVSYLAAREVLSKYLPADKLEKLNVAYNQIEKMRSEFKVKVETTISDVLKREPLNTLIASGVRWAPCFNHFVFPVGGATQRCSKAMVDQFILDTKQPEPEPYVAPDYGTGRRD